MDQHQQYLSCIQSKAVVAIDRGLSADQIGEMNPRLKPHQADIARWCLLGGARAVFAAFGLGKTMIQIQIMVKIAELTGDSVLIICPLGVRGEFKRDAQKFWGVTFEYIRTAAEMRELRNAGSRLFITNYERVRDGDIDPNEFGAVSLDEASVLRSFGSKTYQTFLELFERVRFKFVATATPSPNRYKELIHYAGFLGVMDTGQALTRFFKRDSTQAGNLTLHPHKAKEFWLWVSSWATFLERPSDLGYDDTGYELPELQLHRHRLPVDHADAGADSWGQERMFRNAAVGISEHARERRDSLDARIAKVQEIIAQSPERNWIIWHDLEAEREALEAAIPGLVTVYGSQDLEAREQLIADFSDGKIARFATKPIIAGSGCNFQRHCYSAIYFGIGHKFNDFIQSIHRLQRFLQEHPVDIHLIHTESEDSIYDDLMHKWDQHKELVAEMTHIVRRFGLHNAGRRAEMQRSMALERRAVSGELFTCVNNDNVHETSSMADASVKLILTSVPFSDHYEYTESYYDFGHNDGDVGFFQQMQFLTPQLHRVLEPGRMYVVHVKDRVVYGSVSGLGMYSVNRFSDKFADHTEQHGFVFCGRVTIVTDVVRENNQTYRLGWSENAKDGTKMGCGSSEYLLLFRKLPTDRSRSYADTPVVKSKSEYSRARWQMDAHGFWRSAGNVLVTPDQIAMMPQDVVREMWSRYSISNLYDFAEHVQIAESLEKRGVLPSKFMLLEPRNPGADHVWDDVVRMRTLNCNQAVRRVEQHVCPLQLDVVERVIERYSNKGDLVYDPFGGLMTVAYVAVQLGRRGYGCELNPQYFRDGAAYCRAAEQQRMSPTLFDLLEQETIAG